MPSIRRPCPFCGHMYATLKVVGYDTPSIKCGQCHGGFVMTKAEIDAVQDKAVEKYLCERYNKRPSLKKDTSK